MDLDRTDNRLYRIALVTLLVLGAVLRFHGLTIQSYWLDELHSAGFASPSRTLTEVIELSSLDAHPPLFHIILWWWYQLFGLSEMSGRALPAVFGVLGLFAMYRFGRALIDRKAALVAVAITTPLFFHVFYSQEVRSYSLLFLLTILCWHAFLGVYRKPAMGHALLYAFVSSALLYTHLFGLFVLASQAILGLVLLVWRPDHYRRSFGFSLLAAGLVVLAFLPWVPHVMGNAMLKHTWISPVGPGFIGEYVMTYFRSAWVPAIVFTGLIWLIGRMFPDVTPEPPQNRDMPVGLLLGIWILVTYALPYLVSVFLVPVLIPRVTMITLPALILFLAWPANGLRPTHAVTAALMICILMTGTLIVVDRYYDRQWKEDWRSAVRYIMNRDPSGAYPVVTPRPYCVVPYFEMLGDGRAAINPVSFPLRSGILRAAGWDRVWYLDVHDMKGPPAPLERFFSRQFRRGDDAVFYRASVTQYALKPVRSDTK